VNNGRIEYSRSKTTGRRRDNAFISIKIPNEAKPLLEYAALIDSRYAFMGNLRESLTKGKAILSKLTGIPELEYYKFRYSFGNYTSNTFRKPTKRSCAGH